MVRVALTGLLRRRARSLLAAFGIAIGVTAVVAFMSVAEGLERSARGLINLGGAEMGVFQSGVRDLTASTLPESLARRLEEEPGVADATPVLVLTDEAPDGDTFLVFGVDPGGFVVKRLVLTQGRRLRGTESLAGDGAARELGLHPGGVLEVEGAGIPVAGVYHTGVPFEDQGVAVPLAEAQRLAGREGEATTVAVAVEPGVASSDVADRIERDYPGTLAIDEPGQATRADTNSLLVRKATLVIAMLALVLGGLTVVNTMASAALERRSEFALLAAVGWSPRLIARLVLTEGLALGLAGVAIGLALGSLAGGTVAGVLGASTVVAPATGTGVLALGAGVGLAMGLVGALYPAWRVARIPPAEALA